MGKSFAEILQQVRAIFQTMTVGKMMSLFVMLAATIAGLVVFISWSGKPEFVPLYSQLAPNEAGEIVALLREKKIEYKLSNSGEAIQIPRDKVYEVRLDFASKGLPRGGNLGFEVFDGTKLGVTDFVQNINYQRALQGELSRTINELDEVESSRVHIVMSPRSLFIEEEEPASASIILKLKAGRWLRKEQVQGIVHLVSSSVPRLTPENVTLVDQNGELLAGNDAQVTATKTTSEHQEIQRQKEKFLEQRVSSMLEKVLGQNKAIVRVACDLNFIQQEKTEELFLPDNQVVRSEQLSNELSAQRDENVSGVPGLAANILPDADKTKSTGATGAAGFRKEDNTRNYEIGKTISRQIMPIGQLQRLSVAVIVDGTYEKTVAGSGKDQEEQLKYIPRTVDEIQALENIVKRAVNYDEVRGDKVEVANIAFNTDEKEIMEPNATAGLMDQVKSHGNIIKYGVAALFVIFAFFFIIRPVTRWLTETSWEDVDLLEHLPNTVAELEKKYSEQGELTDYVGQVAQLISSNQEDSGRLLKQWLKET